MEILTIDERAELEALRARTEQQTRYAATLLREIETYKHLLMAADADLTRLDRYRTFWKRVAKQYRGKANGLTNACQCSTLAPTKNKCPRTAETVGSVTPKE